VVLAFAKMTCMWLVVQIVGSLLVLFAFVAVQAERMTVHAWMYLWLNTVGSLLMAVDAVVGHDWGFLMLEGTWAIVSAYALYTKSRGHTPSASH
jgi:membrane-bound ClpP family serine protease